MGETRKLLLPFEGVPLVQHAIDVASQSNAMSCTLVVGSEANRILALVDTRRCAVVENELWKEGIAGSVRAGLTLHPNDEACIFMLADQPFIVADDLNRLIAHHLADRDAIIALRAGEVWGSPMLFPRSDFHALAKITGDAGAKRYAQNSGSRLRFVLARSPHAFADVDTKKDYERIRQLEPRT